MIEQNFITDQIFTLANFLSAEECLAEIDRAQFAGFDAQAYGARGPTEVRRRAVLEDAACTNLLWERTSPFLPPLDQLYRGPLVPSPLPSVALSAYVPTGMNPRLRYYGYYPGERFPEHFDISYEESPESRSFLTFIVYLNEGYRGGETRFGDVTITPRLGMALLFPHELRHEGAEIVEGWKCILRSDVMYRLSGE
jgi:hypothetical protein